MEAQTLTLDMLARVLAADDNARNKAVISLCIDLAIRPCEIPSLRWRNVTLADGTLSGRCIWQTRKKGARRDCALSPRTVDALAEWKKESSKIESKKESAKADFLFPGPGGGKMADSSARHLVSAVLRRAGLDASAYSIRHCVLSEKGARVIAHGGVYADLSRWSGHRSSGSVARYVDSHQPLAATIDAPVL